MLFIDFSSAFNTTIPQHLTEKLSLLGINTSLCNWILDFLTGRPQSVWIGNSTSSATTLNTGAPQGCVLSPLLFTLLTHDCAAMHSSNHIIKFANDTTVVGLISKNDESAYREEVQRLTAWCKANNLFLNVEKTKEMVVDFRRAQSDHSPLNINEYNVEIVKSTKFLGVHLAEDLTWSLNISSITKKAQQHLYFLRSLRKAHIPPLILTTFYKGTIESILSSCITAWYGNCTVSDHKTLQRIVRTAEKIIRVSLPSIMDIYSACCIREANSIVDDPTHTLFTLLPSGKSGLSMIDRSLLSIHLSATDVPLSSTEPTIEPAILTSLSRHEASFFLMLPPQHTRHNSLTEHLQQLFADVEGCKPSKEVQPALSSPAQSIRLVCELHGLVFDAGGYKKPVE
ncbi:hypothetical protein QTP86_020215, partial [Hemibagrus guttatus]